MENKFKLSEKRKELIKVYKHRSIPSSLWRLIEYQDKEFIRLLKESLWLSQEGLDYLDELAGDELL